MTNYLFFDLDGTITNPKVGITKSVQYALNHFGISVDDLDTLTPFIGPPLKDSFMSEFGLSEAEAMTAVDKYREYFSETGIFENVVYDGMAPLLATLKQRGKTLIVATSKPTVFAQRILTHFNLAHYFTDICGSGLDHTRTKKEEVIGYALAQNAIIDLTDVVMIGDRKHDIIGAKQHGLLSVGVLYGFGDYDELAACGADHIVRTVGELSDLLQSSASV